MISNAKHQDTRDFLTVLSQEDDDFYFFKDFNTKPDEDGGYDYFISFMSTHPIEYVSDLADEYFVVPTCNCLGDCCGHMFTYVNVLSREVNHGEHDYLVWVTVRFNY